MIVEGPSKDIPTTTGVGKISKEICELFMAIKITGISPRL